MISAVSLWLLLAGPAAAQDVGSTGSPEDFALYQTAMTAGQRPAAADALLQVIDDPARSGSHAEAWCRMADLLKEFNLPTAELYALTRGIETDPLVASPWVARAISLAETLGDESQLGTVFANNLGANVDAPTRSKMALMASRELLRADELGESLSLLVIVDKNSPEFADAELLRGVLLSMQGRHEEAVAPMLTAQAVAAGQGRGERFDTVVNLNVARTYYGAENWAQAIYWFDRVPRSSEYWPEAAFEKAWAYFRAEDMRGALAQLLNHEAPNFDTWYFPEADILRAYSEFMMCKFSDASKSMDGFVERYQPLRSQLDSTLASVTPQQGWQDGLAMQNGTDTVMPDLVLRSFAFEERLAESRRAVEAAEAELGRLHPLSAAQSGPRVQQWIEGRRDAIIASEGARVIQRARGTQQQLADLLNGIELTRLDLLNLETEMYERASVTGELDFGDKIGKLRDMRRNKKGHHVWPFQGEFWADEMGWYEIDARPDCPSTMSRGDEGR